MGWSTIPKVIKSTKIAKNLTTKRAIQDAVVKAVNEGTTKGLAGAPHTQSIKQSASKTKVKESKKLKELSYKWDKLVAKKDKNIKETKTLLKATGATASAGAGAAGVSLYNKKK